MTDEKQAMLERHELLNPEKLAKVCGVSVKTAQKWLDGNVPEPAARLVRVVYGEVPPETYRA